MFFADLLPYFFSDRYRKQIIFFSWPQKRLLCIGKSTESVMNFKPRVGLQVIKHQ